MNAIDKRTARERGQALVETALSMLIVLVLLAGLVDFGLVFGYRVALANGSRGGARFASRYPTSTNLIEAATVDSLRGTLVLPIDYIMGSDPDLTIHFECDPNNTQAACATVQPGQRITVTVGYNYQPLFVGLIGFDEVPIGSSTVMTVMGDED